MSSSQQPSIQGDDVGDPAVLASAHEQTNEKDRPEKATQGGFMFIESTGPPTRQDRQQLRKLRGHVMHNYLERKDTRKQVAEGKSGKTSPKNAGLQLVKQGSGIVGGQKMRFRMRSGELELRHPYRYRKGKKSTSRTDQESDEGSSERPGREQRATLDEEQDTDSGFVPGMPVTWLGSRKIDVFGVLPVRLEDQDNDSLHNFQRYQRYPWCPINGQSSWSSFAISDQLVFHATMFSWGMHMRSRRSIPDPEEEMRTLQHKVKAISLINDRLSDTSHAATDETVAAVAALTNIALVIDSYPEASKHMSGLWAIVQMRGGLSSLKSNVQQHLQRLISWNDLIYSEVFDEKLRFPPIEVWDESWGAFERRGLSGPLPGLSSAELRVAGVPRHGVLNLLNDIRDLCEIEQTSPLQVTNERGRMKRGDMFHRIERKLRVIIQGDTAPGNNRWDATVWRAVSLAALLFTHHHLRGNPLKYRHFNVLSMQLYDTLLTMDEDLTEFDFAPALLIWILTTGAVVSKLAGVVHASFTFMLGKACRKYRLSDYEQYRWTLSQFLWTGQADEVRYATLWSELEPAIQTRYVE